MPFPHHHFLWKEIYTLTVTISHNGHDFLINYHKVDLIFPIQNCHVYNPTKLYSCWSSNQVVADITKGSVYIPD